MTTFFSRFPGSLNLNVILMLDSDRLFGSYLQGKEDLVNAQSFLTYSMRYRVVKYSVSCNARIPREAQALSPDTGSPLMVYTCPARHTIP